jgi:hypothetical protein
MNPKVFGLYVLTLSVMLTGCAKGALWRLGYLSPQAREQWAEEEKIAKTWPTMRDEMAGWVDQAKASGPADQQRVAKRLAEMIEKDQRVLVRLHATHLLGQLPAEAALGSMVVATRDPESDVRVAACRAYGQMGTEDALIQLGQIMRSDDHSDVRIAATRAIGRFQNPRAAQMLNYALESQQPALQLAAAESLQKITGEKFGKDIPKWQDYVAQLGPANSSDSEIQPVAHNQPDEIKSLLNSLKR